MFLPIFPLEVETTLQHIYIYLSIFFSLFLLWDPKLPRIA